MKRFVKGTASVILSVVLLITTLFSMSIGASAAATSGSCGNNASWSYNDSTKTLTITGTGATKDYNALISKAPWETYKSKITTLVVGEGITSIGNYNFYNCTALVNVSLPSTLEALNGSGTMTTSYGCFQGCTALRSISLPNGLTTIGNCVFKDCANLTSIVLPDSVTTISYGAFCECSSLETVTFGTGLTSTGENAFYNSGVKRINWGENITSIPMYSFFGCKMTTVDIPDSVTSIGLRAFADCVFLTSVTVNNPNLTFTGDPCNGSEQSITIYGHRASTAETYATEKNYAFVSIDACDHEETEEVEVIAATCTTDGLSRQVCKDCGAAVSESVIKAFGHTYSAIETVNNTEIDGHIYTEEKCVRCNEQRTVIEHQRVEGSLTNYIWIDGTYTYTNTATCSKAGYEQYNCSIAGCNQSEYHIVQAGNHTVEQWIVTKQPTCEEKGTREGLCSSCNTTLTEDLPATGHTYSDSNLLEDIDTTEEDGHHHYIYECQNCHEQIDAPEHKEWVEGFYTATIIAPARCTIDGVEYDACDICKSTRTKAIPANGEHDWYETSRTEPTCTAVGKIYYACHNCNLTKSENIESLGHDYVKSEQNTAEPTCTQIGSDYFNCSRCSATKQVTIPALGHDVDKDDFTIIAEASCEDDGSILSICTRCNEAFTETVPALGHDYVDVKIDLEAEGKPGHSLVTPTCSRCGNTTPSSMSHDVWMDGLFTTASLTPPTCNVRGTLRDTCTICNTTRINYVDPLGHLYNYTGNVTADGAHFRCSICLRDTYKDPDEVLAQWNTSILNSTVINRSSVDDSSYLDANGDGIINVQDYAILRSLSKRYAVAKAEAEQTPEEQPEAE